MSDPFRRNNRSTMSSIPWTKTPGFGGNYPGEKGLLHLFNKSLPFILVRTDPRVDCTCADDATNSGDTGCLRCFGTGKVVRSLDRFRGYLSAKPIRAPGATSPMGNEDAGISTVYAGRWLYPSIGDLVLVVGWNLPSLQVMGQGLPRRIDKVLLVTHVDQPGFEAVTYTAMTCVNSITRLPLVEDMLLFGKAERLPPYADSLP